MQKPFQRIGSSSNAQVGRDFESVAQDFFSTQGIMLRLGHAVPVGFGEKTKSHSFDLGCSTQRIIVECKCHRWTSGHNIPSAKLTVWNEAMYYFHVSPPDYRKIMFVLRDLRRGTGESLSSYYFRTYDHLIPAGVEFWEYDEHTSTAVRVGT